MKCRENQPLQCVPSEIVCFLPEVSISTETRKIKHMHLLERQWKGSRHWDCGGKGGFEVSNQSKYLWYARNLNSLRPNMNLYLSPFSLPSLLLISLSCMHLLLTIPWSLSNLGIFPSLSSIIQNLRAQLSSSEREPVPFTRRAKFHFSLRETPSG